MHELIIVNRLIDEAKKHGEVKSIKIEVGDLADINKEDLEKTLKQVVDWKVKVVRKKARVKCVCGYEGEPDIIEKGHLNTIFNCPKCASLPDVLDGEDIKLLEVKCA